MRGTSVYDNFLSLSLKVGKFGLSITITQLYHSYYIIVFHLEIDFSICSNVFWNEIMKAENWVLVTDEQVDVEDFRKLIINLGESSEHTSN